MSILEFFVSVKGLFHLGENIWWSLESDRNQVELYAKCDSMEMHRNACQTLVHIVMMLYISTLYRFLLWFINWYLHSKNLWWFYTSISVIISLLVFWNKTMMLKHCLEFYGELQKQLFSREKYSKPFTYNIFSFKIVFLDIINVSVICENWDYGSSQYARKPSGYGNPQIYFFWLHT